MADPILGSNAILRIYKNYAYRDFLCATDISIEFNTELKATKTIGDGVWKRYKPQNLGYSITLNGLMKLNETDAVAFDLFADQLAFTEVLFRMTFEDTSSNVKAIFGTAIIETTSINGPSEGFVTESFRMMGVGEPDIFDTKTPCTASFSATISAYTGEGPYNYQINISSATASTQYIDVSINGGARSRTTWGGASSGVIYLNLPSGANTIKAIPICTNGYEGTIVTLTQTV